MELFISIHFSLFLFSLHLILLLFYYIYFYQGNNITDVPTGAFGKLPVVFELNLHNNQISNIRYVHKTFFNHIDNVSYSFAESLIWCVEFFNFSSKAFDGLLQLLKLNMSMNNIRSIPSDAFTGLVSLRSLDLSYNQLKKLDNRTKGVLDDCLSLEKVCFIRVHSQSNQKKGKKIQFESLKKILSLPFE